MDIRKSKKQSIRVKEIKTVQKILHNHKISRNTSENVHSVLVLLDEILDDIKKENH